MATSILNQKRCREFALTYAKKTRAQGFNRVSAAFLQAVEADLHRVIRRRIDVHPSKGKTLR